MDILFNKTDYAVGSVHTVDKDLTYALMDEETGKIKSIKGTSLESRIRKDLKTLNRSISNLQYSKPYTYRDVPLKVAGKSVNVKFDMVKKQIIYQSDGVSGVEFSLLKDSILVNNNVCLYFRKMEELQVQEWGRNVPYWMEFACPSIRFYVNDSSMFEGVIFENIILEGSLLSFTLVAVIYVTDFSRYDLSNKIDVVLDLKNNTISSKNFKEKLLTLLDYTKLVTLGDMDLPMCVFGMRSRFSNFYLCGVSYDGRLYGSSEAAYQSMKTLNSSLRTRFVGLSPDDAKALGRQIEKSFQFRSDWLSVKNNIMHEIVFAKFSQNLDCKVALFNTKGTVLVEDTTGWHDTYWGRCYCPKCNGRGENHLGLILTQVRKELGCSS